MHFYYEPFSLHISKSDVTASPVIKMKISWLYWHTFVKHLFKVKKRNEVVSCK